MVFVKAISDTPPRIGRDLSLWLPKGVGTFGRQAPLAGGHLWQVDTFGRWESYQIVRGRS